MTLCPSLAISNRKKTQKLSKFNWVFNVASNTLSVKRSTKLMISTEMTSQCLTGLHDVFERRTPSIANQVSDILWRSFWSAPLCLSREGGNAEMKTAGRRSRDTSYREIWPAENEKKTGWIFCRNVSHIFFGLFIDGCTCGPSRTQTGKNACSVMKEKISSRDVRTALITSTDSRKR